MFIYIWFLFPIVILFKVPGISHIAKYVYDSAVKNKKIHCVEEECSIGFQSTNTPLPYDNYLLFNGFTWKKAKIKWWTMFIGFCICTQLVSIGGSSLVSTQVFRATGNEPLLQKIRSFTGPYLKTTTKFFGLTPHPVFMDNIHFNGYNHLIALTYINADGTEEWLPIIDEDGQAGYYNFGRRWVNWTFRVNSPSIVPNRLNLGIRRYSAFWAHKNNKSLRNATFKVKVKKIRSPNGWEKGFYNEQSKQPWIDAGEAKWTNNQFTISIPNIETL